MLISNGFSNINFVPGQTVANSAVVPIGAGGSVDIYNQSGSTQVVVDVEDDAPPSAVEPTRTARLPPDLLRCAVNGGVCLPIHLCT